MTDHVLLRELSNRLEEKNKLLSYQAIMLREMEELNERLRRAEKVKSGFLSNIRNEINNPLTSILGLSANIMVGGSIENIKKWSALINREAFNLDFQLNNIFAAGEIEAGEVTLNGATVDVLEIIRSQVHYLEPRCQQHQVKVVVRELTDTFHCKTDPYLFQTIFVNLLANAIEFSPIGAEVFVNIQCQHDLLTVSVQDFGTGISEEDQKHIFERFRQLEEGATKTHQGHGLGLSIVREFTDILQGELHIQSKKGETVMTVTLPELSNAFFPEGFSTAGNELLFGEEESL